MFLHVRQNLPFRPSEKGSNKHTVRFLHTHRAGKRTAARDTEQHRFRFVGNVVRRRDTIGFIFANELQKTVATKFPRRRFQTQLFPFGLFHAIVLEGIKRHAPFFADRLHEPHVRLAFFAADTVLAMYRGKRIAVFFFLRFQKMQKRRRIRSARRRHAYFFIF